MFQDRIDLNSVKLSVRRIAIFPIGVYCNKTKNPRQNLNILAYMLCRK